MSLNVCYIIDFVFNYKDGSCGREVAVTAVPPSLSPAIFGKHYVQYKSSGWVINHVFRASYNNLLPGYKAKYGVAGRM